ncbi:metal-dependent hydrolase [Haloglomus litoreum]|uniref:metal-dependent hydrolase n=1 Tax=Haloglomus litoreum TaxID=3034026 RepID=UPI0023E82089|nr:metal-dependent hydrolase [Haloglomus sp. DT116]
MFVGHGLLAFALAAAAARVRGWSPERALALGLLAGAFGLAPDVDILYAPVGVLGASGPLDAASGFWRAGNEVHRAVTHSLVVATVASLAAGAWTTGRRPGRLGAVAALSATVAVAFAVSGALGAVVLAAFGVAVLGLARVGRAHLGLGPAAVATAGAVGTLTHPFGDLFTGEPPAILYPLDVTVFVERVVLAPDPTLHLLGALFVELGTAWLAALVLVWLRDDGLPAWPGIGSLAARIDRRAGIGLGYAGAAVLIPAPTLEVSYHFVFPLLAVGAGVTAAAAIGEARAAGDRWRGIERAALSGLAAVTLAALAYTAGYLLLG